MNSNIKISGTKITALTLTLLLSHCQFIHTYAPTTILASQGTDTSLTLTSATDATSTLGTAVITTIPATLAAILNNTGLMYIQAAVSQVISAASNPAISCTLVGASNAGSFNSSMTTVFTNLTTAINTTTRANILTVQGNITTAQGVSLSSGTITSPYIASRITYGLAALQSAVTSWLTFYPSS